MAAVKPPVDNAVNERRLRPIYDCLDNGNNKKALQEAAKLLKKQENFQCAKVLKALALMRLSRQDESLAVLHEVHSEHPADDATLQAMTICYWELHKPELIADAYENASKKEPQNEEFLTHLFMAYVRLAEYKKQQQTAMTLYKVRQKNPYYFWAVMSIVMQARSSDEKLAKTMFYPLAQKMAEKHINDRKVEAEEVIELYLMILNLQEKYEEALNVLNGPLADHLISSSYIPQRKADLLVKLEKWRQANCAFKDLLAKKPDDWASYKGYFQSLFKIMANTPENDNDSEVSPDSSIADAAQFLTSQISSSKSIRGPYLARLELLRQSHDTKHINGTLPELLLDYFERFASKMCCYSDLKPYLNDASESEKKEFVELLNEKYTFAKAVEQFTPTDMKDMQVHIAYVQIQRYLNQYTNMPFEKKLQLVDSLTCTYKSTLKFMEGVPVTDVHPGNDYIVIAIHTLLDIWDQSNEDGVLLKAITLLEWALTHSPLSHQFKFLLIKLYHKVGAIVPAYYKYNSMDIKHIQLDTIGYVITRYLTPFSYYSAACTVFGNTHRFFTSNYRDTIDYLMSSYKNGSFTKIFEFVKFRERLNNSVQYAKISVERMILDLIADSYCHDTTEQVVQFMAIKPEKDTINWTSLEDNRDLDVMSCWRPNDNSSHKKQSFNEEIDWLKLRQLTVRSICACVLLTKSIHPPSNNIVTNGVKSESSSVLQDLIDQMSSHSLKLQSCSYSTKWPLQGPYPTRLFLYLQNNCSVIILEFLKFVLNIYNSSEHGQNENKSINSTEFLNKIKALISKCKECHPSELSEWPQFLETLTNLVETMSFVLIILGCYQRVLKPYKLSLSKKGKKKNKETVPPKILECLNSFNGIYNGIESCIKDIQALCKSVEINQVMDQFSSLKLTITKDNSDQDFNSTLSSVQDSIRESYQTSIKELSDLIQHKIKYLSSVNL